MLMEAHTPGLSVSPTLPPIFANFPDLRPILDAEHGDTGHLRQINSLLNRLYQVCPHEDYLLASLLFYLYPAYQSRSEHLQRACSPTAWDLYLRLMQIDRLPLPVSGEKQRLHARNMVYAMTGDLPLLTALLIVRLQRSEHIEQLPTDWQIPFAEQTLHIYAPLAHRLGIFWIKAELEDTAFQFLQPDNYYSLKKKVAKKRHQRSAIVESMSRQIRKMLIQAGIRHQVYGRYKRFYSIYEKLKKVDQQFERIQDLIALRILLHKVEDCYAALSYIHEHWTPKDQRYKDYIAQPKPNGYQSLHTTILTQEGEPVEVQIRTHEMHAIAEYGVAAHWLYKESDRKSALTRTAAENSELRAVLHNVYTLTPQGEIIELPEGSTPVDFAYAVHTDVGNQLSGALVNGSISKIDTSLVNGDQVEILTSPKQRPSKEWLLFVKTKKAQQKIRHAVREQQREEFRRTAWEQLDKEFRQHGLNLNRMVRENKLELESQQRKAQSFEHMLHCIGQGSMRPVELAQWFLEKSEVPAEPTPEPKIAPTPPTPPAPSKSLLLVEGLDDVETSLARCCSPQKGDDVVGYLGKNRVIKVHRRDCDALAELEEKRLLDVHWNSAPKS
jgi:GTP pyrophosphokinase